ncbi:inactive protein RESTRICTED TEV MOVEMENT 1-like [Solanum dulcamara]|uniref:inactive protein RESTRICTED TEV MOVEMENT 1-like n=1 Tax=Solanum dulcamara TaxID=45834 RepID=UPI0024861DF6|nr:inactive protein RESTRICTED TEV MOVEMENT 1-like [Solanum dulcamara]
MDMVKVGPVGGVGGTIWDEKGRDKVAGINVYYNKLTVVALEFLYYENDKLVLSNKYGDQNGCGNFSAVVFDYPSEFLTSISSSYGDNGRFKVLEAIKFSTNKGSYGPFGRTLPTYHSKHLNFQLGNHSLFGGFHGTMSPFAVKSIGIYVKPNVNMKYLRVKYEK